MVNSKKFVLKKAFKGEPKISDFELIEEELPAVNDGEILCEAVWLSVDPYMRAYSFRLNNGATMIGTQVARVVQSKHKDYKTGDHVFGHFGWKTHTICNPDNVPSFSVAKEKLLKVPDLGDLTLSQGLGAAGMPGNTAYFGLLEICLPKPEEVVVVSGAAGAVGHLVGQIAKIKGCKVIGFTGSDEKVRWLVDDLKFDAAFNYKNTKDITAALKEAAPDGIDCYFDNVGGPLSSAVLYSMRNGGRIAVCGSISTYNADLDAMPSAPAIQSAFVSKQLKMEGFMVSRWTDRWLEGIRQNLKWMKEGKMKVREHVVDGFEHMPEAFIGMLKGENIGKTVVRA